MQRCAWDDLPEAVHREVERRCGPIGRVRPIAAGMNNAAAGIIEHASGGGTLFYKGIRGDDPRAWMYRNEVTAAKAGAPGPTLRWVLETGEGIVLGWDHIEARHADLAPGASDLDLIAKALYELADRPPLDDRTAFARETQRWEQMRPWRRLSSQRPDRLDPWVRANLHRFSQQEEVALKALTGTHLAHTDLHERNILIDDKRAHLIDWAWARRAAPWVDAEMLALRLVAAGHPCEDADRWRLDNLPYAELEPQTRRMFAAEMLGIWLSLAALRADRPLLMEMSHHALQWAKYLHGIG